MKKSFISGILILGLIHFAPQPALASAADAKAGIEDFITSIRSMEFPIKDESRHAQLVTKTDAYLDFETLGKKALGANWDKATPEQQKEYLDLLTKLIASIAYPRSKKFMGQYEVTYPDTTPSADGFVVHSVIKQQEEGLNVNVLYHVYEKDGHQKINDIIMDDVSITEDLVLPHSDEHRAGFFEKETMAALSQMERRRKHGNIFRTN